MAHEELIRAEFARQAASFEDAGYSFGDPRLLRWFCELLPLHEGVLALEIAAGTGHVARAMAPDVRQVVALDLTPEMLATGKRAADEAGISNVLFQEGDAAALPYLDASFDLVVSRFAFHHFPHPGRQAAEMVRVCRPDGHVAVMDLVSAEPDLADAYNDLERRRDPSHCRALGEAELARLFEDLGAQAAASRTHDQRVSVDRWLAQSEAPADVGEAIRSRLDAELAGGEATGMRPSRRDGELLFTQRWSALVFRRGPHG